MQSLSVPHRLSLLEEILEEKINKKMKQKKVITSTQFSAIVLNKAKKKNGELSVNRIRINQSIKTQSIGCDAFGTLHSEVHNIHFRFNLVTRQSIIT